MDIEFNWPFFFQKSKEGNFSKNLTTLLNKKRAHTRITPHTRAAAAAAAEKAGALFLVLCVCVFLYIHRERAFFLVCEKERENMLKANSPIVSPPIRCLSATTTTSSGKKEEREEEKMLLSMMKRALMVISKTFGEGEEEEEREAVSRLGAFVRRNSNGVALGFKVSFLLEKTTSSGGGEKRRRIPSAKTLLRLKCLEDAEKAEGAKMLFLEWQSAFYERLWMDERSKNARETTSSTTSKSDEKRSVVVDATSPDGPLLREGYARTPSTAGKTSATMSSVEEEEEEEEEEDKCDYREWNAITRSPILKIQAATRSNRNSEDSSHLALPISNLLQTLILEEEEEEGEGVEEREEGVVTPRPTIIDKNNFGDENFQFAFRTPEQSSKNKKDPQCLTPPGAPLRVRNSFRRVSEEKNVARFGAWNRNRGGRPSLEEDEEDEEEEQAPRRSLF